MKKKLKILVVGPGLIGKQHIRLINENEGSELASIVAPDHVANHEIAKSNNTRLYHTLADCLTKEKVDGVIISSPNKFHAEQGKICIEAGIPVLIEKPITSLVDDGVALVELADRYKAKILVGHHRAHSPLMTQAREIIQSGRLGRLVSVIGCAQFYKPSHYFVDGPWRKEIGGGPILINLIHEIGNLRSLCGEISAVQAITSSAIRGFPVEDTVVINFMFESGALGAFLLSDTAATARSWEQTSRENPSYPTYADEDSYNVAGTLGSLAVPTMRLKYYPEGVDPSWWTPFAEETLAVTRQDPLRCQFQHFLAVIHGEADPIVSARDGLRNLQVIEAVRESALQHKLVHLNY
jgi:predicted dehydrogenase